MLSGRLPFMGDRAATVLYSVVHGEPKPLKEVRSGLSPELQEIVNRALKTELKARYASAAAKQISELGRSARISPTCW